MIIIIIIILYCIQIRYTNDFPSTGTRLVLLILQVSLLINTISLFHISKIVKTTDKAEQYRDRHMSPMRAVLIVTDANRM